MKEIGTYLTRFQKMDELIVNTCTGTPKEFAVKIGVCKRTLHDHLNIMKAALKESNVMIIYNYELKSYQYTKEGRLEFTYKWISNK